MRNSDKVNFIGFSTGGKGCNGTKVRFAVEQVRRSKVLQKIGATNIIWHALPQAMTKAEAVQYLQKQTTALNLDKVQQDAIVKATSRLIPKTTKVKTAKVSKNKTTK